MIYVFLERGGGDVSITFYFIENKNLPFLVSSYHNLIHKLLNVTFDP